MIDTVKVVVHGHALNDEFRIEFRYANGEHHLWAVRSQAIIERDDALNPALLKAIASGEVTVGGMAELGWRYLGQVEPGAVFR